MALSRAHVALLIALLANGGCQTAAPTNPEKALVVAKAPKPIFGDEQRVASLLKQHKSGKLEPFEETEFVLFADSLVLDKKFDLARELYLRVFQSRPNLSVGFKLTQLYLVAQKPEEAETVIRKLVILFPAHPEPALELANIYEYQGNLTLALKTIADAHKKHPESEPVSSRYADLLVAKKDIPKAKSILQQALHRNPDSPLLLLKLAHIQLFEKDLNAAAKTITNVLRVAPENIEGWLIAGMIAVEQKKYNDAENYFRVAHEKRADDDAIARQYVMQLLRQDKYLEAKRVLLRLEDSAPLNLGLDADLGFQLAFTFLQLEDYENAKSRFEKLLDKSTDPRLHFYLGQCEEGLKNPTVAMTHYDKVPSNSEFWPFARQRIVISLLELGKKEEALQELASLQKLQKADEGQYRFSIYVYARVKDYALASKSAQEALAKYPKSSELKYLYISTLEFTEGRDKMVVELRKFVKANPAHAQAMNHLGYTLAEMGVHLDEAILLLQKALAIQPQNGFYLDSLGWAFFRKKDYLEAEKYLLEAAKKEPAEPIIYEHLAEVKKAQGDLHLALKYFEQAKTLFGQYSKERIEQDREWKQSFANVEQRLSELRRMALP